MIVCAAAVAELPKLFVTRPVHWIAPVSASTPVVNVLVFVVLWDCEPQAKVMLVIVAEVPALALFIASVALLSPFTYTPQPDGT